MHTLLFSDTHLSDRLYRKKRDYLRSIIEPADRVIIVGDFWDGFLTTFGKFVNSGWSDLFPLLKQRQTVYLYGNHDRPQWSDERVNLFSVQQGMEYQCQLADHNVFLTHGHTIFSSLEEQYPILNRSIPLRLGTSIDILHKLVWGQRFMSKNSTINQPLQEWASKNADGRLIITGHSHYPQIDLDHHIINTGFVGCGYGNYITAEQHDFKLVKERYWQRRYEV